MQTKKTFIEAYVLPKQRKYGFSKRISNKKEVKHSADVKLGDRFKKITFRLRMKKLSYEREKLNEILIEMYQNIEVRSYNVNSTIYFDKKLNISSNLKLILN